MQTMTKTQTNAVRGYSFAMINAVISGFAIFINTYAVKIFANTTVYTTLKNAVAGIILAIPILVIAKYRRELKQLTRRQYALLALLALIGGSAPYALTFRGYQLLSSAMMNTILSRTQFIFVAFFAVFLLKERITPILSFAFLLLLAGVLWGLNLDTLVWNQGAVYIIAATVLFALTSVFMKYLLSSVSPVALMAAKMTFGSVFLVVYIFISGQAAIITKLTAAQWEITAVTGVILMFFTLTSVYALQYLPAAEATAISAASPLVTALLVMGTSGLFTAPAWRLWPGYALIAAAVTLFIWSGFHRQNIQNQKAATVS